MPNPKGNIANLKPFKKGDDERRKNNGRKPKLPNLDTLLADVMGEIGDNSREEAAKTILKALRLKAIKGDVRAAEVLLDRAYGKAKQVTDILSGGHPLQTANVIVNVVDSVPPMIEK